MTDSEPLMQFTMNNDNFTISLYSDSNPSFMLVIIILIGLLDQNNFVCSSQKQSNACGMILTQLFVTHRLCVYVYDDDDGNASVNMLLFYWEQKSRRNLTIAYWKYAFFSTYILFLLFLYFLFNLLSLFYKCTQKIIIIINVDRFQLL